MAIITTVLPIAFGLFSLQFPAGLVLYFLVSNLWRLGQQEIIMRKITRPGQAALAATKEKDTDAIDVSSVDTSAFPRAKGGLRKLFQLPAAADGEEADGSGGNGADNGASKPAPSTQAKGTTKGSPTKGATSRAGSSSGSSGGSKASSGASSGSGSRRRNNKKRKRR